MNVTGERQDIVKVVRYPRTSCRGRYSENGLLTGLSTRRGTDERRSRRQGALVRVVELMHRDWDTDTLPSEKGEGGTWEQGLGCTRAGADGVL